jgi:hypothetical protein
MQVERNERIVAEYVDAVKQSFLSGMYDDEGEKKRLARKKRLMKIDEFQIDENIILAPFKTYIGFLDSYLHKKRSADILDDQQKVEMNDFRLILGIADTELSALLRGYYNTQSLPFLTDFVSEIGDMAEDSGSINSDGAQIPISDFFHNYRKISKSAMHCFLLELKTNPHEVDFSTEVFEDQFILCFEDMIPYVYSILVDNGIANLTEYSISELFLSFLEFEHTLEQLNQMNKTIAEAVQGDKEDRKFVRDHRYTDGLGWLTDMAVDSYQNKGVRNKLNEKKLPFVIDFIIDLEERLILAVESIYNVMAGHFGINSYGKMAYFHKAPEESSEIEELPNGDDHSAIGLNPKEIIERILSNHAVGGECLEIIPSLTEKKTSKFISLINKKYGLDILLDDTVAYYDETLMGSGRVGALLTDKLLVVHISMENLGAHNISDIKNIQIVGVLNRVVKFDYLGKKKSFTLTQNNKEADELVAIIEEIIDAIN